MAKPKLYGSQRSYVPNAKADMRRRKKGYQRGRERAERDPWEDKMRRKQEAVRHYAES